MDYFRKFQEQGYQVATYSPVTREEASAKVGELRRVGYKTKIVSTGDDTYTVLVKPKGSNKKLK
jgi:hypothetical protein